MKATPHQRPTHVYIGRLPCGCAVALTNDSGDKFTAQAVKEFITEGLAVNRETWQKYVEEISKEATFMACPHQASESTAQLSLFGAV